MNNPASLHQLHLLLVDDERFVLKVNHQVVKTLTGKTEYQAESARQAIRILNEAKVDVLITDIQMPEMNGLELMKLIRCGRTKARADLPILVITSFSNTEVLGSSIALDVNGFLVKPISPKLAREKIQSAVGERIRLRPEEEYAQVETDLESLASRPAGDRRRVNASILKSEGEEPYPALRRKEGNGGKPAGGRGNDGQGTKQPPGQPGLPIPIDELEPGMVLNSNLCTHDGTLLLTAGQTLNERLVNRIRELREVLEHEEIEVVDPSAE
ncbi:response regulator [Endothiovibrio diazotrophicus]